MVVVYKNKIPFNGQGFKKLSRMKDKGSFDIFYRTHNMASYKNYTVIATRIGYGTYAIYIRNNAKTIITKLQVREDTCDGSGEANYTFKERIVPIKDKGEYYV